MAKAIQNDEAERIAAMEEGVSVTAGYLNTDAFYRLVEHQKATHGDMSDLASRMALAKFLNLARRDRSLSLEQLAARVDATAADLSSIEEGGKVPEPRLVSKLARALEVAPGRLMQLAGHVPVVDEEVSMAAHIFAVSTNSKPLDQVEKEALNEFTKVLAFG